MSEMFKARKGQKPVRIASTTGHVVIVGEDWQDVPDCLVSEAIKNGLLSKDLYDQAMAEVKGELMSAKTEEPVVMAPVADEPAADEVDHEKNAKILQAIMDVLDMQKNGEKTTKGGKNLIAGNTGKPTVGAVSELAGFKVSAEELDEALR